MEINKLLKIAVEKKASDLHLVVGHVPVLRIDTEIKPMKDESEISNVELKKMVEGILTVSQKKKFYEDRELDLSYEINNVGRFRINLCWEKDNVSLVSRIINNKIPNMNDLGLNDVVAEMLLQNQGLILVTGPTGSGKSTTLASMVNYINENRKVSIITLEDPIEYLFPKASSIITQRELGSDMKTFAAGLKHVLRQDPDIVMVGEMRDLETIALTLTLAETGHLVLATLHTPNASQVIDRIVDVFPAYQQTQIRMQFSMVLNSIIAQRILPKKGGGLIVAREILINTPAISNIIRENKIPQIKTVIQTSADKGMSTMVQAVKRLYEDDLIEESLAASLLAEEDMRQSTS
ncbi:MAG: PilT/PilU family type 4a pilus ATPase [Patescibacteria group bacterium]|nr:PilT/PilU family type 4a pilus ATPase [Patescibacteria group bacterium]MDD4304126.1 PilT/PilU family type 4a pilus ATPase [Patescibacteria group bacterium]MDD4695157.1 PilT/PilU family type 4a pilus ATPase [Patescibacteria group bacterium]